MVQSETGDSGARRCVLQRQRNALDIGQQRRAGTRPGQEFRKQAELVEKIAVGLRSALDFEHLGFGGKPANFLGPLQLEANYDRRLPVGPENGNHAKEIEKRHAAYVAPEPRVKCGYLKFYAEHVSPASEGATMPR
jgi:hypothetical protein